MTQWLDTLSGTPAKHTAELPCSRQSRQFFLIFYLHIPGEEGGWRAGKRSEFSSLSPARELLCKGGQISSLHFCIPWDVSALLCFYSIKQESDSDQFSLGHSERRGMGVFWGWRGCPWDWTETYWRQIGLTTQKAAACVSLTALTCHPVWLHSHAALNCLACPWVSTAGESSERGGDHESKLSKVVESRISDPAASSDPRFRGAEVLDTSREYKWTTEQGVVTLRDFSGFPVCFSLKAPLVLCDPRGLVHCDFFSYSFIFLQHGEWGQREKAAFLQKIKRFGRWPMK